MRITTLAFLIALTGCAPAAYQPPILDPSPGDPSLMARSAVLNASWRLGLPSERATLASHIAALQRTVWAGLDTFDPNGEQALIAAAQLHYRAGRVDAGLALLQLARDEGLDNPDVIAAHVDGLSINNRHAEARTLAFDTLDALPPEAEGLEALRAATDRAIDTDPVLMPPTVRVLVPDENIDKLKKLGGGSTITLKAYWKDAKIGALKPEQDLGQSMFRSEIAYYRLCALIRCNFKVPYNEHVKIARRHFERLYDRVDSPKQRGYKAKFVHLTWRTEDNGTEYLHGTLKEWIPEFTSFGIERADSWRHFLQQSTSTRKLDAPVSKWLPYLADALGKRGWRFHKRLVAYTEGMTTGELARGISDLLVVDFLTNNWDRFSGDPNLYGANCHFVPGQFLALDNGASFPPWNTDRVARRLNHTQRFSRPLILALRRLEYDATLQRLFPDPDKDEIRRFDIFWERRTQLLERVDGLIDTYGEDAILYFR